MTPAAPKDAATPALASLLQRRSVSPRRLGAPGPSPAMLEQVVQAGLRAPDHGALTPWRLVHIPAERQGELGDLFAQEKLRRDPMASPADLARAREHATQAPTQLAFVVCLRAGTTVPQHEQWLSAGAALAQILAALHALGFGAIVLSGDRCADAPLCRALGLQADEILAGFISAGSVIRTPPAAAPKPAERVWSTWSGRTSSDAAEPRAAAAPLPQR